MKAGRLAFAVLVSSPVACVGVTTPPGGEMPAPGGAPGGDPATSPSSTVQVTQLRRLTRREYNNTARALLGDTSSPADGFPRDPIGSSGYEEPGATGSLETEAYMVAAEALAAGAQARLPALLPCSAKMPVDESACFRQFIDKLGARAYRRPLLSEEVADLGALFTDARKNLALTFPESIGVVLQALLQSPSFLYHREIGPDAPVAEGDLLRLTGYEMASRLSYILTGRPPDDPLFQAAAAGELIDPDGIDRQVQRLALFTAASESMTDFVRQWLALDTSRTEKSRQAYPEFEALVPNLLGELQLFVARLVKADLPIQALFTDPTVFVDKASASVYGLSSTSARLSEATASAAERAGIFTQLAFLSVAATATGSHPIKRGKIMLRNVLCGTLPPPPPNVPAVSPPEPGATTRERFARHAENPCASCHALMDPLGFAFETYDGIGRYRTTEAGKPIDSSGKVTLPSGAEVTFQNAVDLLTKLSTTSDVVDCLARQVGRYATGTTEGPDQVVSKELLAGLGTRRRLVDFLVAATRTQAFRYRRLAEGEVP